MTPPRLVVFDVDGTLIDSQHHIHAAMSSAFSGLGLAVPDLPAVLSIVGLSLPEAVARLARGHGPAEQAAIVAAYKASFSEGRERAAAQPYPGALAAIERLAGRPGVVLGVATGKSRRGLDHVFGALSIAGHFRTIQVADDHPSKPHPSMLHAALAETGCQAADAVMIGDTTYDIAMGRAAGMPTIGVTWGYHAAGDLHAAGASVLIDRFDALDDVLDMVLA
jgi:phosphoglycolate phosphatase